MERNATLAAAGAVAERDLEMARNTLAGAQAQLASARAQLSSAREQLGKTTVNAPISGIVSDRPVSAGSVVQMGGPLFVIVDPGSMRLEASVPAAELGQVRIGAPVRFTVTGYPGQTFTGTVQRINPAADPVTRQVPVLVSIPNAQGALVSGLFAEGRVQSEARQGIVVPADAVDERGVQPMVVRLNGGKAERVAVTLGVRDAETDRVEITGGVNAGDTLLVGAALGTTPGTRVTVGPGAPPPQPGKETPTMFISDFAIKRPVVTSVTMLALVVFGIFALLSLDTDEFPEVEAPFVFVSVPYPGASPDIVEREVVDPIEEAVAGISGVDQIQSQALDGFGSIQVMFVYEKDVQQATQDIRDAISQIRGDLPQEMEEPILARFDPNDQPIVSLTLSSQTHVAGGPDAHRRPGDHPRAARHQRRGRGAGGGRRASAS